MKNILIDLIKAFDKLKKNVKNSHVKGKNMFLLIYDTVSICHHILSSAGYSDNFDRTFI